MLKWTMDPTPKDQPMPRKIIYLINPISGTKGKSTLVRIITEKTTKQNIPFEILPSNVEGDYHFLKEKIINENITDVVVCGGDGTMSAVSGSLLGSDINMGIIPMGSGNGLALAAKIPVKTSKALDIIFSGKALPVDGFFINGQFSCMLCGIGFDAQVAHDFALTPKRGLQTYIRISMINFFKAKPFWFNIESKVHRFDSEAFLISIANSNQFGNNFKIAPQASLHDGLLDIVIVKKMNKIMLPFSVIGQITGINAMQKIEDHINRRNIFYFQTSELIIKNKDLALLHIDGDPKPTADEFKIKIQPNAFRLMQPVA